MAKKKAKGKKGGGKAGKKGKKSKKHDPIEERGYYLVGDVLEKGKKADQLLMRKALMSMLMESKRCSIQYYKDSCEAETEENYVLRETFKSFEKTNYDYLKQMIDTMDRIRDRLTDSVTQDQEKIKMEKKLAENRLKGIVDEMEEHTNRVRQLETELDNGLKKLEDIRSYQRDGGLEDHERLLQQTIRERDDLAAAHQRQLDRIQERFEKYIAITNRKIDDEFKAIDKAARNRIEQETTTDTVSKMHHNIQLRKDLDEFQVDLDRTLKIIQELEESNTKLMLNDVVVDWNLEYYENEEETVVDVDEVLAGLPEDPLEGLDDLHAIEKELNGEAKQKGEEEGTEVGEDDDDEEDDDDSDDEEEEESDAEENDDEDEPIDSFIERQLKLTAVPASTKEQTEATQQRTVQSLKSLDDALSSISYDPFHPKINRYYPPKKVTSNDVLKVIKLEKTKPIPVDMQNTGLGNVDDDNNLSEHDLKWIYARRKLIKTPPIEKFKAMTEKRLGL